MNDMIHYKGTLRVSTSKKGTRLDTKIFHNSGTINLFRFLANCLTNNFDNSGIPQYIQVFSAGVPGTPISELTNIQDILANNARSGVLYTTSSPRAYADDVNDLLSSYEVVYKFTILDSQIYNTQNVNMFALYDGTNKGDQTQPSAYFFITGGVDGTDPTKLGSIDIGNKGDLALIVEWIMTIGN